MRVAIITESFPPDVNGVAHCVLRVAELLTGYGHHPLVIAPRPPQGTGELGAGELGAGELGAGELFPFPVVRVPAVPLPGYPSFRLGLPSRRVRDALIRLVPPCDPGAFTAAVARLAADPAARAAFGAAGRRKVLGRTWPALTEELIGHYAAVLGRTRPAKVAI